MEAMKHFDFSIILNNANSVEVFIVKDDFF